MKQKLRNIEIIPSKRQRPNLKKILIRTKFTSQENTENTPKVKKCKDKRCETCKKIVVCSQIEIDKQNKTLFDIKMK